MKLLIIGCLFSGAITWLVMTVRAAVEVAHLQKEHDKEMLRFGNDVHDMAYKQGRDDERAYWHELVWHTAPEQANRQATITELHDLRG